MSGTNKEVTLGREARARRAHDDQRAAINNSNLATIQFALEAIRTAALINGGSVLAGLTFASELFSDDGGLAINLMECVFIFAIGVVLAGLASGFGYFSQYSFTHSFAVEAFSWDEPFISETGASKLWKRVGVTFQILGIFCVLASYAGLVYGMLKASALFS